MNFTKAISILTNGRASEIPLEWEFAFATFSAWLHSPDEPLVCEWMSLVTFNSVLANIQKLAKTPTLDWYLKICEPQVYINNIDKCIPPIFWQNEDAEIYHNNNYVSDIVRFLLTFTPDSSDKRKKASLGKAYEYLNKQDGFVNGDYGSDLDWYVSSFSGQQAIWKRLKFSAPFQFVKHHGSSLNWNLDVREVNYFDELCKRASNTDAIQEYFAKVAWVQLKMKNILDIRSMPSTDYHQFPASLTPVAFDLPPMPRNANSKMASYTRKSSAFGEEAD